MITVILDVGQGTADQENGSTGRRHGCVQNMPWLHFMNSSPLTDTITKLEARGVRSRKQAVQAAPSADRHNVHFQYHRCARRTRAHQMRMFETDPES